MRLKACSFCVVLLVSACDQSQVLAPDARTAMSLSQNGAVGPVITGSGHHTRVVGTAEDLTTFSFTAVLHADGSVSGRYQYNFRVRGFAIHGPVTCATVNGTQAWVGGVVDQVITSDPAFESLLGLEMWWRSVDNGEDADAAPDQTSGVGFEIAGNPTTAASWCAGQPAVLPLRVVEHGNVQVR